MRRSPAFTLIELLIVIAIIGVLAAALLPTLWEGQTQACVTADAQQLKTHFTWQEIARQKKVAPTGGGSQYVLCTWTSGVVAHTEENFDKYFVPGARENDPDYRSRRSRIEKGLDPWPELAACTSADTHYVGRAAKHLRNAGDAGEAIMADDNENGFWSHGDGTVNVLLGDGNVRTLSYASMRERYGLGPFDKSQPIATCGEDSVIPECRKLAF